jgi:hypothetical protein
MDDEKRTVIVVEGGRASQLLRDLDRLRSPGQQLPAGPRVVNTALGPAIIVDPARAAAIAKAEVAAAYAAAPRMPANIARLPTCPQRKVPVPWFVDWDPLDPTCPPVPDFRIADVRKMGRAHREQLCWICGQQLAGRRAFVIGPMCACNRISSEPPSHVACADYAAMVCPFLAMPHMRRRDSSERMIASGKGHAPAGIGHDRNPGVCIVWETHSYALQYEPNGVLFKVGHPLQLRWMTRGRLATRDEAAVALVAGVQEVTFPMAVAQGPEAVAALQVMLDAAWRLLPKGKGLAVAPRLIVQPEAYAQLRDQSGPMELSIGHVPPLGDHTHGQQEG